jgi:hypothetical protein
MYLTKQLAAAADVPSAERLPIFRDMHHTVFSALLTVN